MLFSIEEIKDEFQQLEFQFLREETIELSKGKHYLGKAEIEQFVGTAKF